MGESSGLIFSGSIKVRALAIRRSVLAALASLFFVASPAYAVTIYSNFGSGVPGYNTAGGALIISPLAWAFTAAETANVTQIDIPFFAFSTPNSFTVSLNDAASGINLGAMLGSWTLQNVTTDRTNDLHTISGITGVTLDAGVSYFLSVTFDSGSGSGGEWNANTIGASAPWIQGTVHSNIGTQGAFDVLGETPLPAALPLFVSGLGALGLLAWRRKKKAACVAASLCFTFFVALSILSMPARASTLVGNLTPSSNANASFEITNAVWAENFSLSQSSTITALGYDVWHPRSATNTLNSIDWYLYSDSNPTNGVFGTPLNSLASGTVSAASASVTNLGPAPFGAGSTYDVLQIVVTIPNETLAPGDYWVGFHENPSSLYWGYWTFATTGDGLSAVTGGSLWGTNGNNLVFQVDGQTNVAPLPAALPLFVTGISALGLLGWLRRSRRVSGLSMSA